MLTLWGGTWYIRECLAESLGSIHWMPISTPTSSFNNLKWFQILPNAPKGQIQPGWETELDQEGHCTKEEYIIQRMTRRSALQEQASLVSDFVFPRHKGVQCAMPFI